MQQTQLKVNLEVHHLTVMNAIKTFERIALAGKSPHTKKWYTFRLDLLARELGETRPLADVLEIDLLQYREKLENKKISPDTLHGYIRAVRRLFRWLHRRGITPANIAEDVNLPKLPKRGRKGISDSNAQKIIQAAKEHSPRDYALIMFLASSSSRRRGIAELRLKDLNLDAPEPERRRVTIFEKGEKERSVFIDEETRHALLAWLNIRPHRGDHVFTTPKGAPLTPSAISEILDRYKAKLHLSGSCSPHQWRHRWFRRLLQAKLPISQAAQIGGHTNIQITHQFYGQFAVDELQEAYDRHSSPNL